LTPQERAQGGPDHGLLVEDATGPAARAGVRPGDVVLGIDGEPAKSVEQVRGVVRDHRNRTLALLIERDGQRVFVPVRLG
jgi:serine protease Do